MQQMTNILLSKTGNSAANSAKTSSQESNNEDFSSTLASVTASSLSISASKKTIANTDDTVQVTSADKVKDDDISTEDADVNLIFAQISMANDMKKTASDGDSLPLAFLNAEEDITGEENIDTSSALLTGSALAPTVSDNSTLAPTISADLALASTVSAEIELASDIDADDAGFSAELQKLVSTSPDMAAILIADDVKPSSLTDKSLVHILPIDPNILEASADCDAVIDPNLTDDASELPLEDTELVSATEVGVSIDESLVENEVTLNAVINQAGLANSATIKSATNTAAKATTSSSTVNSPNTGNIATSGNTFDLNTLGSSISSEPLDTTSVTESDLDGNPNSDLAANLLLKDAKLTVAMDIPRDESFMDDSSNTFSELKSTSSIQTLSMSQLNRQETMQVQLSLRQGVEQQNQMQEMIQRFSPVMKQQLITMVSQGIQHAEIRLDPPELGHMLVKIQVHGDQTQVQFHVTQPQTRDLVEQAMPRLRELLQEQGMQLADSHVSQGDQGERREGSFGDGGSSNAADMDEISAEELHLGLNQAISVTSGIDYYA